MMTICSPPLSAVSAHSVRGTILLWMATATPRSGNPISATRSKRFAAAVSFGFPLMITSIVNFMKKPHCTSFLFRLWDYVQQGVYEGGEHTTPSPCFLWSLPSFSRHGNGRTSRLLLHSITKKNDWFQFPSAALSASGSMGIISAYSKKDGDGHPPWKALFVFPTANIRLYFFSFGIFCTKQPHFPPFLC